MDRFKTLHLHGDMWNGANLGSCLVSPHTKDIVLTIPKNASTWMQREFTGRPMYPSNYHIDGSYSTPAIVVIRDPIDRWYSGIAEYFAMVYEGRWKEFVSNPMCDSAHDIIFNQVSLDLHTERQSYWLEGLDPDNITFIKFGENMRDDITDCLNKRGITCNPRQVKFNNSASEPHKMFWQEYFKDLVRQTPSYLDRIVQYYDVDFKLIQRIQFYER